MVGIVNMDDIAGVGTLAVIGIRDVGVMVVLHLITVYHSDTRKR
jgi:hypothetical protein